MNTPTLFQPDSSPEVNYMGKLNYINDYFFIVNDLHAVPLYEVPTRLETTVLQVCLDGFMRIGINMQEYYAGPGTLIVTVPDQIIQNIEVSDDHQGMAIAMTRICSDDVFSKVKSMLPLFLYTKEYPCISLQGNELKSIMEYYSMLWKKSMEKDRSSTKEIIQHLVVAMFYEIYDIYRIRIPRKIEKKNRKDIIYDQFMRLLSENYREERSVNFYADRLFLTPKHLSSVVKRISGKTAGEWIDTFVIFEAKSLLRSSQKNIQEIADELNFANQSFFGKYFKHYTGISPKEFRRM